MANRLKTTTRDVQIHAAVTIMPNKDNIAMIGEKENEIGQFAVQLDAKHVPVTEKQFRMAFASLCKTLEARARAAGLIR